MASPRHGRARRPLKAPKPQGRQSLSLSDRQAIQRRLVYLLNRWALSRAELFGRRLGVSRYTWSRWLREDDPRPPDHASLLVLARTLHVSVDWLLIGHGDPELPAAGQTTAAAKLYAAVETVAGVEPAKWLGRDPEQVWARAVRVLREEAARLHESLKVRVYLTRPTR